MSGYDSPLTARQIAALKDKDIDFSDIPELDDESGNGPHSLTPITPSRSPCVSKLRVDVLQSRWKGLPDAHQSRA